MLWEAFNFLDSYDDAEEWLCLRVVALGDMTPNGSVRESIKRRGQKTRVRKIKDFHYTWSKLVVPLLLFTHIDKKTRARTKKDCRGIMHVMIMAASIDPK
jgi:hypothetical protein